MSDDEIACIFYPMRTCTDNERLIAISIGRAIEQVARRAALEEAAKACMRATPDAQTRKAIGDAAHYLACAVAIRALADGETHE